VTELNLAREQKEQSKVAQLAATLKYLGEVLGLLQNDPESFLQADITSEQRQKIESLIAARAQARQEKNWQEADRLRQELSDLNLELEDTAQGTKWRVKLISNE
jgi:cysteinyl-tRNA synthetase